MSRNLRLEINGRTVRNPILRTVIGVIVLLLVAALLLILGVIFLPLFVGILVVAAVAGGIWIYRVRRFLRQAGNESRRRPGTEELDPSMEVHVRPDQSQDGRISPTDRGHPAP